MSHGPILHCTARLLRELDPGTVQPEPGLSEPRASWCLNILTIERKKCLLATHAATLYSVFVPEVRRKDLRSLPQLLAKALAESLAANRLTHGVSFDPASAVITRTTARFRSVQGVMNQMAFQIEWIIAEQGGLARCDLAAVRSHLNDTLFQVGGVYATAFERVLNVGRGRASETQP